MIATPVAGHKGRVQVGSTTIYLSMWRVTSQNDLLEITNFESLASKEYISGLDGADVEFSGFLDADLNPFDTAGLNLQPGVTITNLYLYVNKTGSVRYSFGSFIVESATVTVDVKGKAELQVRGKATGVSWSYPGGF